MSDDLRMSDEEYQRMMKRIRDAQKKRDFWTDGRWILVGLTLAMLGGAVAAICDGGCRF